MTHTTKTHILELLENGSAHLEYVEAPELGDDVKLAVRPLTKGEVGQVNGRSVRGQAMHGRPSQEDAKKDAGDTKTSGRPDLALELDFDLEELVVNEAAAETLTIALGLSCDGETWTEDEAARLPASLHRRLLEKVREVTDDPDLLDEAATFRSHAPGA